MYKCFESRSGTCYLYESLTNGIFELSAEERASLPSGEGSTDLLVRAGIGDAAFPCEKDLKETFVGFHKATRQQEGGSPELLVVEMTQQCNFRCSYCIYSGSYPLERTHSDIQLGIDDLNEIVDRFFGKGAGPDFVSFYGGEPLLRFEQIKAFCKKVEQRGGAPRYSMTTNGILLGNEEVVDFLVAGDFQINVSFDGLNHDAYRRTKTGKPTASQLIANLSRINEAYPGYLESNVSLSITLAPPYRLKDNADFFSSDSLLSNLRMSVSVVNEDECLFLDRFDREKESQLLNEEILDLADRYITTEGDIPHFLLALFASGLNRIKEREMSTQGNSFPPGQCAPGIRRLFVTSSGDEFMCERVGGYGKLGTIGEPSSEGDAYEMIVKELDGVFKDRCPQCYLARICDMCCSSLRYGNEMKDAAGIEEQCEARRRWYDLIFYIFLSRKEQGKGLFAAVE